MRTVTQKLNDDHGIFTSPGNKIECPKCNHKTFSIRRDDLIGKCFHPSCGFYITPKSDNSNFDRLNKIFNDIRQDFRKELHSLEITHRKNAYYYLVEERGIHPQVIRDSDLGAIPYKYDIDSKFASYINDLEIESKIPKKGRPRKNESSIAESKLEFVKRLRDKLKKCITGNAGSLAFFYTNVYDQILSIRFRKPYTKQFFSFKPFKSSGLFGHHLFSPAESEKYKHLNEMLLVTEGEFNQLQLQSLIARIADNKGLDNPPYTFTCAVGSSNSTDLQAIKKLASNPIICYDNDEAGKAMMKKIAEKMTIEAVTTPKPDSDLDSFITSFGLNDDKALAEVKQLIKSRKKIYRSFESLAEDIYNIRMKQDQLDNRREHEIFTEVANLIREDLIQRGKFFHDKHNGYLFLNSDKKLMNINQDELEYRKLIALYGIKESEKIYKYITADLQDNAYNYSTETKVYYLAYYNPTTFTVYLYNFNNQIYRISPQAIDLVDNGTDGILFLNDGKYSPFKKLSGNGVTNYLDEVIFDNIEFEDDGLSKDEQKIILKYWFYSLFFESIMPTKPILAFIGEKGSGKSSTLRKIGMLLFGGNFDVTALPNKQEDFETAISNSYFTAIDNADTKKPWLDDILAVVATGGMLKRRQLYTTNKMVEIPAKCYLGITARTPKFRRDDVADRLLIMKVKRIAAFMSEKKLNEEVLSNRDSMMTEVIEQLQIIVTMLEIENGNDYSSTFRMADFADFSLKLANQTGTQKQLLSIFEKLNHEQSVFTLEDDPVFIVLSRWVNDVKGLAKNKDRELTTPELWEELMNTANIMDVVFPYRNPMSFAQKFRHIRPNLEQFFDINEREERSRKKYYRFQLKDL